MAAIQAVLLRGDPTTAHAAGGPREVMRVASRTLSSLVGPSQLENWRRTWSPALKLELKREAEDRAHGFPRALLACNIVTRSRATVAWIITANEIWRIRIARYARREDGHLFFVGIVALTLRAGRFWAGERKCIAGGWKWNVGWRCDRAASELPSWDA